MNVTDVSADLGADVLRWGALGKTAWRVLRALRAAKDGATAVNLATTLQMNSRTLRRALGRLQDAGMAQPIGDTWHWVAVDLKLVAQKLGTDGAGERQREQHRNQRLAYRELLEGRRRRRQRSARGRAPSRDGHSPSEEEPS